MSNTPPARSKPPCCTREGTRYAVRMNEADGDDRPNWTDTLRARLPYVIGALGLLAWFALLYFMLRDAL